MVSFAHPEQVGIVAEVCQSFVLDNGAFSFWKSGKDTDWRAFFDWVKVWSKHPGLDWILAPDVIEDDEDDRTAPMAFYKNERAEFIPHQDFEEPLL